MVRKQMGYVESDSFFPKDVRKKFKLGEFAETKETPAKKTAKKKSKTAKTKK